jgi:hypothetical protein
MEVCLGHGGLFLHIYDAGVPRYKKIKQSYSLIPGAIPFQYSGWFIHKKALCSHSAFFMCARHGYKL